MKNKKGFTLIEIIVCIGLIVLVGTSSIVGFKVISNKKLINKLDSITERASEAAQVYIETNDTAYNQLYNNKNGVSLPLRVLVNEGLLSLEGTDLTEKDIENQYVVTFLGGTGSSENCEQITSTTSWGNDKAIYLCMNSNGSSNLATIDPTKYGNKTQVSNEPYYFTGLNSDNYVSDGLISYKTTGNNRFNLKNVRIFKIDRDDTIVLAIDHYSKTNTYYVSNVDEGLEVRTTDKIDVYSTTHNYDDTVAFAVGGYIYTWLGDLKVSTVGYSLETTHYHALVRLPSSCKITSGTGSSDNPFTITC